MKITSTNNQIIKDTVKLHQKKYRDKTGLFLVEGYHLFEEAKANGHIKQIFTTNESIHGQEVIYVTDQVLQKLAQAKNPQGVLCVCEKVVKEEVKERVLLLDQIQDPGNLGTLLRSAVAFGFETVVLDQTVDVYNDKVLRSTQGAIYKLNIIEQDIVDFIDTHQDHYFIGTSMEGNELEQLHLLPKLGLILGNEGSGIRENILAKVDQNMTIKMRNTESLNVAVAGSIIMHYIANR
jgi:TrmH family RNA methyltransferase